LAFLEFRDFFIKIPEFFLASFLRFLNSFPHFSTTLHFTNPLAEMTSLLQVLNFT